MEKMGWVWSVVLGVALLGPVSYIRAEEGTDMASIAGEGVVIQETVSLEAALAAAPTDAELAVETASAVQEAIASQIAPAAQAPPQKDPGEAPKEEVQPQEQEEVFEDGGEAESTSSETYGVFSYSQLDDPKELGKLLARAIQNDNDALMIRDGYIRLLNQMTKDMSRLNLQDVDRWLTTIDKQISLITNGNETFKPALPRRFENQLLFINPLWEFYREPYDAAFLGTAKALETERTRRQRAMPE